MAKDFTFPRDLKIAEQKRFDSGQRVIQHVKKEFPLIIKLRMPKSSDLKLRYNHCRDWAQSWAEVRNQLTVEHKTVSTMLHTQVIPCAVRFKNIWELAEYIGRTKELEHFEYCCEECRRELPELLPYIEEHPRYAFEYYGIFEKAVAVCRYMLDHPRPGIYLRELDLPGVDTKFLERHTNQNDRGYPGPVGMLLDFLLPPEAIDPNYSAPDNFVRRYGFKPKPEFIRFHVLDDSRPANEPWNKMVDVQLDKESFAKLSFDLENVIICENEVSYLALPKLRSSLAIFGKGYGFSGWEHFECLKGRRIIYWGDLDVDGFSILNQLRSQLPGEDLVSAMMDEKTIKDFTELAVSDRNSYISEGRELRFLTDKEREAYQALLADKYGTNVRIEQERLPYSRIHAEIEKLLR